MDMHENSYNNIAPANFRCPYILVLDSDVIYAGADADTDADADADAER
jgi:hypothetical protein